MAEPIDRGSAVVVGAGVFGLTAALELRRRGWEVAVVEPGPIPNPRGASADVSRMVRADYGADDLYVSMMEAALPRWRAWEERWGGVFHQDGILLLARGALEPGGFEHDSLRTLQRRGFPVSALDPGEIARRFPAWLAPGEAVLNRSGGWAGSAEVIGHLASEAGHTGVRFVEDRAAALAGDGAVGGVRLSGGGEVQADVTVVAGGAWTPDLVPGLDGVVRTTGHPIFLLRPADPSPYRPPAFPPWAADVATTGWYGFPETGGLVKIADHGPGTPMHPDDDRSVAESEVAALRAFLARWLPGLADAPLDSARRCLYTGTADGDFLIDRHPDRPGLVVATGGSGHAFKFAPVLGSVVADVVEGAAPVTRFAWPTP